MSHEADAEAWPRISVEMRVMLVDEAFLEEFGIDFSALTEPTRQPAEGAFVVAIDDLDVNLLVSAALAQQHSLVLPSPRMTLPPGEVGRVWAGPHSYFIHDIGGERYLDSGGFGFEFVAEPIDPADPDAGLRVVMVVRLMPEGVRRGEELVWAEGSAGMIVYPEQAFRVQAECGSGVPYLAALPVPAEDAIDNRRMLLLFKPVLVLSPEHERQFYPGLEGPPPSFR